MEKELIGCGELMKRLCDIFETKVNKDLQEQDITISQMKMLICLDDTSDGSATLKELEKYFGSSQATIAGIAVRLEKKELIESYIDAEDRRIKHVRISKSGKELCQRARKHMEESERLFFAALSLEERKELQSLLQRIYNSLL